MSIIAFQPRKIWESNPGFAFEVTSGSGLATFWKISLSFPGVGVGVRTMLGAEVVDGFKLGTIVGFGVVVFGVKAFLIEEIILGFLVGAGVVD